MKYKHSMIQVQSSCPKDVGLRRAEAERERESTNTKHQQGKDGATKAQQVLSINKAINS
jgi:hypothetical protein